MPYIHPAGQPRPPSSAAATAGGPSTPTKQPAAAHNPAKSSPRASPHIRPSPAPSTPSSLLRRHIHRIPPPAILPPIVDATHSALHLTLKSEAGSTLSTQVDELLSRHLAQSLDGPSVINAHVRSGSPAIKNLPRPAQAQVPRSAPDLPATPPSLPPKPVKPNQSPAGPRQMASPGVAPARRPLPIPPSQEVPYQYPASYGPSVSKVRSFPAQPPASSLPHQGLPPGAAYLPSSLMPGRQGLGYGHPQGINSTGVYSQPWLQAQVGVPSVPHKPQDTVSRTFAKGGASVFLHKGFFDLLSMAPYTQEVGSNADTGSNYDQGWLGDKPMIPPAGRAVTSPVFNTARQSLAVPAAKGYRRVSVDMIGKPTGFA